MVAPGFPVYGVGGAGDPEVWFTRRRFALMLAIFIAAAFPDVLFGLSTFAFRDYGLFGYPLAAYYRECLGRGELPLWNPLNNCGIPFAAQWCPMVFYPFSLIYLILPLSWSLGIFCLVHLFLAGLGMYSLAYHWVKSPWAASVAGTAYAFNGLMLNSLMWPHYMAAFCWMPWVVRWVESAWREGRFRILVAAGGGVLQMMTGAPEVILCTWVFLLALWGMEILRGEVRWLTGLTRLAGVILVVGTVSAIQLGPFFELLQHSQRDSQFAAEQWAMPLSGWANLLVPLFRCHPSTLGLYFQHTQHWTFSYYLGIGAVTLALLAVWSCRQWQVRFLAAIAGVSLILALGKEGYLYSWLRAAVPPVGFMRFPVKFVLWTVFSVPLLAAFGLSSGGWGNPALERKGVRRLGMVVMVVLGLVGAILGAAFFWPHPLDQWSATWVNGLGRAGCLALLAGSIWVSTRVGTPSARGLLQVACLVIIWFDALAHMPGWKWVAPRWVYAPGLALADRRWSPLPRLGESRAMVSPEAQWKLDHLALARPEEDYISSRLGLFSNCNLLEGIPKVDGFFPLYLREENQVRSLIYGPDHRDLSGLLDFLGVSQMTAPGKLIEWMIRPNYLPMITCGQKPVFAEATNLLRLVMGSSFDPRHVVFLPKEVQPYLTVTNETQADVLASRVQVHRIQADVAAAAPCLVVIAQSYYPNWHAYVDGQPTPLWRANHAFQALEIPAGRHTVELIYQDRAFWVGAGISVLSLLACITAWFRLRSGRSSGGEGMELDSGQRVN